MCKKNGKYEVCDIVENREANADHDHSFILQPFIISFGQDRLAIVNANM